MITINKLPPKQFKKNHPTLGEHKKEGDNHIITIPFKASTLTKLHELGHCYINHPTKWESPDQHFNHELEVEIFAFEKKWVKNLLLIF